MSLHPVLSSFLGSVAVIFLVTQVRCVMKLEALQLGSPLFQGRRFGLEGEFASERRAPYAGEATSRQAPAFFNLDQEREKFFQVVQAADARLEELGLHVRLKVAEKSERLQVEVYNPETKEVIRRLPPDEIIKLAESIEKMAGVILDRSL